MTFRRLNVLCPLGFQNTFDGNLITLEEYQIDLLQAEAFSLRKEEILEWDEGHVLHR